MTPARIRVGCNVQAAYFGPAQQWFNSGPNSLSDEQIANFERVLSANPNDTCARGYLIAHGQGFVAHRRDHVVWMIENHPEWDGFMLNLPWTRYMDEPGAHSRIKTAWLQQVGSDQLNGTVLHHAAVFFESREPDFAVALLERAIRLEPEVSFHIEGLGILYARSQFGPARDSSFAVRAKSTLLSSTNWLILAGALNAIGPFTKGTGGDLGRLLFVRLGELAGNQNPIDLLADLPSRSAKYRYSQCDPVPLLRRCSDTLIH